MIIFAVAMVTTCHSNGYYVVIVLPLFRSKFFVTPVELRVFGCVTLY